MRNFVLFIPLTVLFLTVKCTVLPFTPLPDLPLIIVFYLACERSSVEGAFLSFIIGYIDDVFHGAVAGITSFALVSVFIMVYLLAKKVHFSTPGIQAFGVVFMFLIKVILIYTVLSLNSLEISFLSQIASTGIVTGIFTPLVIVFLKWLTVPAVVRT